MFHSNPYVNLNTPTLRCTADITLHTHTWHSILIYFTLSPPRLYTPTLHCTHYITLRPCITLYTHIHILYSHHYPVQHSRFWIWNSTTLCYEVCGWMSWDMVTLQGEILEMAGKCYIFVFSELKQRKIQNGVSWVTSQLQCEAVILVSPFVLPISLKVNFTSVV